MNDSQILKEEREEMTIKEVAAFFGVHRNTVYRHPAEFGMVLIRGKIWRTSLARCRRLRDQKIPRNLSNHQKQEKLYRARICLERGLK